MMDSFTFMQINSGTNGSFYCGYGDFYWNDKIDKPNRRILSSAQWKFIKNQENNLISAIDCHPEASIEFISKSDEMAKRISGEYSAVDYVARNKEIVELKINGLTNSQIGEMFGLDHTTIGSIYNKSI